MTNEEISNLFYLVDKKNDNGFGDNVKSSVLNKNNAPTEKSTNVVVNVSQNVMPETKSSIVCENCGSHTINLLNDTMGICEHCGAKVIIKKPINTPAVKVNIVNGNAKIDSPYYVIKNNNSESEFKRKAIIYLADKFKDTSTDILNGKFGEVYTNYLEYMVCAIHIDGSYSALVGVDKIEQRTVYERQYDPVLKRIVDKPVKKDCTVTNWEPFSGNVSSNEIVAVKINGKNNHNINKYISTVNFDVDAMSLADSGLNINLVNPPSSASREAVSMAMDKVNYNIPGDKIKDKCVNFSHRVLETKYCIVAEYVMPYWYNGTEYEISSLAPWFDFQETSPVVNSEKNDIANNINIKSRPFEISSIFLSLLSMGLAVIFPLVFMNIFGVLLGVLSMLPSIIGYNFYKKAWNKNALIVYQCMLKNKQDKWNIKLNLLENYLRNNNMSPLSNQEKNSFKVEDIFFKGGHVL